MSGFASQLERCPCLYYRLEHVPDIEPACLGNREAVERPRHDRDERAYLVFVEELQIDVVDVNEVAFVGRVPFKDVATGDDVGEHAALTAISSAAGVRYLIQRSPFGIARMSSAIGSSAFSLFGVAEVSLTSLPRRS